MGLELAAPAVARPPRRRAERLHPRGGHRARARQRAGGARRPPRAPPRSRARSLRGPRPWAAGSGSRRRPTGSSPGPARRGEPRRRPRRPGAGADEQVLAAVLRRAVPVAFLEEVAALRPWSERPRVLARVVLHPRAPRALSLRLVSALYWRDLADVAATARVPAAVRSRAESHLEDGLADMRLGDRVTLARLATPALLPALLADADRRVVASALVNPRLREEDLVAALRRDDVPLALLESVAASSRWTDELRGAPRARAAAAHAARSRLAADQLARGPRPAPRRGRRRAAAARPGGGARGPRPRAGRLTPAILYGSTRCIIDRAAPAH